MDERKEFGPDDFMTAPQFARYAGVERRYLTTWANRGEVEGAQLVGGGEKRGGVWIATRAAWEKAAAKERAPGRPKKKPAPEE